MSSVKSLPMAAYVLPHTYWRLLLFTTLVFVSLRLMYDVWSAPSLVTRERVADRFPANETRSKQKNLLDKSSRNLDLLVEQQNQALQQKTILIGDLQNKLESVATWTVQVNLKSGRFKAISITLSLSAALKEQRYISRIPNGSTFL